MIDDHSTDRTAAVAAAAGARVVAVDDVLPELGPGEGKGEALWKSVAAADGRPHRVVRRRHHRLRSPVRRRASLGPLLTRPDIDFVKGFYDRPVGGSAHGGGRVTELVARPAIAAAVPAPGLDRAAPRRRVRRPPRRCSSGCRSCRATASTSACSSTSPTLEGTEAIAQVDLGTRRHRNRPLDELGPQALAVLQTALRRAGPAAAAPPPWSAPTSSPVEVGIGERPPLVDVPATAAAPRDLTADRTRSFGPEKSLKVTTESGRCRGGHPPAPGRDWSDAPRWRSLTIAPTDDLT